MPPSSAAGRRHSQVQRLQLNGMVAFLTQMLKDYQQTGAVMPSSAALGRAMTRSLRKGKGPRRLLEVGPGTGPFTKLILKALRPGDELHLVEISPVFARRLEEKLLRPFRAEHSKIHVELHCQPVQTVGLHGKFDYIVCSLPFNNFSSQMVRSILRRLMGLLADGGELAYFEYAGARMIKAPLVDARGRRQLKSIGAVAKVLLRRHHGQRELVLGNVPPAVAVRLTR